MGSAANRSKVISGIPETSYITVSKNSSTDLFSPPAVAVQKGMGILVRGNVDLPRTTAKKTNAPVPPRSPDTKCPQNYPAHRNEALHSNQDCSKNSSRSLLPESYAS